MNIRKIVISAVCLLMVAGISVLGTMAYLTDQSDAVVNTFTMGKVGITLDEAKVDVYGNPEMSDPGDGTEPVPVRTEDGNEYRMIPGHTYTKDPTVTVAAGSEDSYVRMLISINCYDKLQEIFDNQFLPENFVKGWDPEVWISTKEVALSDDGKVATYEFRYKETANGMDDAGKAVDVKLPALFTEFFVPGEFDVDDLKALEGLKITVEGHAIQALGFEDAADGSKTAEDLAWEAFEAENGAQNTSQNTTTTNP